MDRTRSHTNVFGAYLFKRLQTSPHKPIALDVTKRAGFVVLFAIATGVVLIGVHAAKSTKGISTLAPRGYVCGGATVIADPSAVGGSAVRFSSSGNSPCASITPVLAATPPMGFNDWYVYRASVTEQDMLTQAKALISTGLSKLGYNYVVIDDGWQASTRAADGSLQANSTTFPHGIAWLASQIHALGLKLGIYEAYGPGTCTNSGALPGSFGHYQQDANTFASWGVDFLKFDNCAHPPAAEDTPTTLFPQMGAALKATGRPVVYNQELPVLASNEVDPQFTPYSDSNAQQFATDVAISAQTSNMWRIAPDLQPTAGDAAYGNGDIQLMKHMDRTFALPQLKHRSRVTP